MDSSLHNAIVDQIRSAANIAGRWTFTEVHGGSINEVYKIQNERGEKLLCKVNSKQQLPGMFEKEQAGLSLLKNNSHFRVPETVTVFTINQSQVLVMNILKKARAQTVFGTTLALLWPICTASMPSNSVCKLTTTWEHCRKEIR